MFTAEWAWDDSNQVYVKTWKLFGKAYWRVYYNSCFERVMKPKCKKRRVL